MSPERANIFLVEDNSIVRESLKTKLERAGHQVVLEADDVRKAYDIIRGGTLDQFLVDVNGAKKLVLVTDGNLSQYSMGGFDGECVALELKKLYPDVWAIGTSNWEFGQGVVDRFVKKDNSELLVKTISEL